MNYNIEQLNSKSNEEYTSVDENKSFPEGKTGRDGFVTRYHWNNEMMKAHQVNYQVRIKKSVEACGQINEKLDDQPEYIIRYADVKIRFEPQKETEELLFENALPNSLLRIPEKYVVTVERSLQEMIKKGALGFPLVGLKATLYDGSYHPIISDDNAFEQATQKAFQKGMFNACPVIMEPVGSLRIFLKKDPANLETIERIIKKRRGLDVKVEHWIDRFDVKAFVPISEMDKFDSELHSLTEELLGNYTFEFASYQEAPYEVQQEIIELKKNEGFFANCSTDNLIAEIFYGDEK